MKRPIAISLSPNTEPDDVARAGFTRRHKEIWEDPEYVLQVEKKLEEMFASAVALTSSGRQALYRLLKALNIGQGDEVITQAFTCIAVPQAILWTGATPVYVDIDSETYNLNVESVRRRIKPTTKAIIVQHTFGIPGPVKELQAIAKENRLALIEDCAHALGQVHEGKLLGTLADAAILSFGRDKILSSVFGGAVVSKNQNLIERIRDQQRSLAYPPASWVRQQLFHPVAFARILPWYFTGGLGKLALVLLQKLNLLSKAVAPEEKKGDKPEHVQYRFSPALAYLLLPQLDKLERYAERRREIVKRYADALEGPRQALLRFPLQREDAKKIVMSAKNSRMLLGDWYDTPLAPRDSDASRFGYVSGSCPQAENIGRRILNLPTYPLLTDDQAEQVIAFIQAYDQRGH